MPHLPEVRGVSEFATFHVAGQLCATATGDVIECIEVTESTRLPSSAVQGTKLVGLVAHQGGSLPLVDMGALAAGLGEGLKHALVMRSTRGACLACW
jgi:chemotaxis signal transduction protein